MLEKLIPYNDIEVITNAKVSEYQGGKLKMQTKDGSREIACDSVILSVGYKEENSLYHELEFEVPEIYLLGDARRVSNIMYGIWDAFEVANHIE
jgi:2-enoate reductase